jgi:hypothetical protein
MERSTPPPENQSASDTAPADQAARSTTPNAKPARRRRASAASANGRPSASTPPPASPPADNGQPDSDAAQLKDAIAHPGGADIPEVPLTTGGGVDLEIPREPRIESESAEDDEIHVGAGPKLRIPREDCDDDDDDDGEEEVVGTVIKIRKPGRRERILLDPTMQMTVKLLVHKPGGEDTIKEEYFYVPKGDLRDDISDELKSVRVVLYFAIKARRFRLWLVKITPGNDFYDSLLDKLFKQPAEVILRHSWKAAADLASGIYRVRKRRLRPNETAVWPDRPMEDILGEALGQDHVISSPDHELYDDIVSGEEV